GELSPPVSRTAWPRRPRMHPTADAVSLPPGGSSPRPSLGHSGGGGPSYFSAVVTRTPSLACSRRRRRPRPRPRLLLRPPSPRLPPGVQKAATVVAAPRLPPPPPSLDPSSTPPLPPSPSVRWRPGRWSCPHGGARRPDARPAELPARRTSAAPSSSSNGRIDEREGTGKLFGESRCIARFGKLEAVDGKRDRIATQMILFRNV
ncbi:unnamed protein product, partial [Urochloa humidicola]